MKNKVLPAILMAAGAIMVVPVDNHLAEVIGVAVAAVGAKLMTNKVKESFRG